MKDKEITISIIDKRGALPLFRNTLSVMIMCLPIYIGVVVGSSAMQWAGFVLGILLFFVMIMEFNRNLPRFHDIDGAIQYLKHMKEDESH